MGARWSHHDDVVRMAAGFQLLYRPAAFRGPATSITAAV